MFDVVSFGAAVADIFVDTDIAEKNNLLSYPVGSKILIRNLRYDIGGGGTNTATAFSNLGLNTGYIGKLGEDDSGKRVLDLLKKEKIKFLGRVDGNSKTGCSIILDSRGGDRTILTYKGANNDISLRDVRKFKTKWLYFSSLLGKSLETQVHLAEILKKRGVKIAFNPSEYLIREKSLRAKLLRLLKFTDILILNKQEAELLAGKNPLKKISSLGPLILVITDKDKKIWAYDSRKGKTYYIMPHKIKVRERTGAGDAFASGFVAGMIVNKSIDYCLSLGLREGESVLREFGAKKNLLKMKLKK